MRRDRPLLTAQAWAAGLVLVVVLAFVALVKPFVRRWISALANLRAAAEMLDAPDLPPPLRERFMGVIRDETQAMSRRVQTPTQQAAQNLATRWAMRDRRTTTSTCSPTPPTATRWTNADAPSWPARCSTPRRPAWTRPGATRSSRSARRAWSAASCCAAAQKTCYARLKD